MKRLELMPTDENILKSLKEDIFKRNQELGYFIQLLDNIEGPYSLAVNDGNLLHAHFRSVPIT